MNCSKPYLLALAIVGGAWQSTQAQDVSGKVNKLLVADGKLIICGQFEKSDRRVVNNITTFDGTKFAGLAKGVDGQCYGAVAQGKSLFVAGDYSVVNKATDGSTETPSNRIAKWDGTTWKSMGAQTVDRDVYAVAEKDGKLYIGGNFTKVGGTLETKGVAVWDGKKWSSVGNAQFDRAVKAMAFVGNDLYVAGIFSLNGDEPMVGIAKWDGKTWTEPFRNGLQGIETLASDGKKLYIGGSFGLRVWDGVALSEIPGGPSAVGSADVLSICIDGNKIYCAGGFSTVKNGKKEIATGGVAMWDGSAWTAFPEIPYANPRAVAVYNGVLYLGGEFTNGIKKWVNGAWANVL
jgi:trimeric autotransporter adhesin